MNFPATVIQHKIRQVADKLVENHGKAVFVHDKHVRFAGISGYKSGRTCLDQFPNLRHLNERQTVKDQTKETKPDLDASRRLGARATLSSSHNHL